MACTCFLFARKGAVPRTQRPRFGNLWCYIEDGGDIADWRPTCALILLLGFRSDLVHVDATGDDVIDLLPDASLDQVLAPRG